MKQTKLKTLLLAMLMCVGGVSEIQAYSWSLTISSPIPVTVTVKTTYFTFNYTSNQSKLGTYDGMVISKSDTPGCTFKWEYQTIGYSSLNTTTTTSSSFTAGNELYSVKLTVTGNKYYNTLSYDANEGSGAPASDNPTVTYPNTSCTHTISSTEPTRTGYTFLGWADSKNATSATYTAGGKITVGNNSNIGDQSKTLYAVWQANATMGGTVITPNAALTLTDGSDLVVNNPVTVSSISYSRNLSYDWGTVCLPFAVSSDANVQYYTLQSVDATAEKMYFEPATTIAANTPAVFKRLNSGNYSASSAGSVTLSTSITPSTTGDWKLVGTFAKTTLDKTTNANDYYIAQNKFWQVSQSENGVTIPAYRAYFTTTAQQAKSSFTISIWDGDEATAIGTINANGDISTNSIQAHGKYIDNGRIVILKNGKKYNTAGQQVK